MDQKIFTPISRQDLLVSTIVEDISNAIVYGKLQPGDQLVEERLAAEFGVSRVPIREALLRLEALGLIEKKPYRKAFVSKLEQREIAELYNVRLVLEGIAVRLLAEKPDSPDLDTLDKIIERMRQAALAEDRSGVLVHDADFHDALIAASGNELLANIWSMVSIKMRRFLFLKRRHTHRSAAEVLAVHEAILQAIRSGDPDQAEAAIASHLKRVEERFSKVNEAESGE